MILRNITSAYTISGIVLSLYNTPHITMCQVSIMLVCYKSEVDITHITHLIITHVTCLLCGVLLTDPTTNKMMVYDTEKYLLQPHHTRYSTVTL